MDGWQVEQVLKSDRFGSVELLHAGERRLVRRVVCPRRHPASRVVARVLIARERRALAAIEGMAGVPRLVKEEGAAALDAADGRVVAPSEQVLRTWIAGSPLQRAERLPEDYFDLLEALVVELHGRGVCHNDLHKEQNVLVDEDGRPALVDFQLASLHRGRGGLFASRARDDVRHVRKHRQRYTRGGRAPGGATHPEEPGSLLRRSWVAATWRRLGKPAYNFLVHGPGGRVPSEDWRPESGPWPLWDPPVGAPRDLRHEEGAGAGKTPPEKGYGPDPRAR
ncbi:MAG: phosphotransferase [Planctomycetota bacterium]|jgi:predicted Ser/Thr protein kinase|nr:phosphotransferase [Planctomycetota bacterium]